MDLSFPGQRTATATSCIPHDSVYMPGPRAGKSDTWLQIFQNDSKICEAEVTLTQLINKICKPWQLCVDPTTLWQCCDIILSSKRQQTQKTAGNVGKGWFQPKQSGIQQLSRKSYNNIVCLLNWYRAVKKLKSTCSSLADNKYNVVGGFGTHS